jgi:acyl-CoA reductase-like NAD-dependent aldehyde dehydrogenase
LDRILGFVESGKKEGAKLELGGARVENLKGYYMKPTIFSGVTDDMTICKEEIFGPVMSVVKFDDIDEVIERANNTRYGLSSGVVTKDFAKANKVIRELRSGMVFWNCYMVLGPNTPFGGWKDSGYGKEGGEEGLD